MKMGVLQEGAPQSHELQVTNGGGGVTCFKIAVGEGINQLL